MRCPLSLLLLAAACGSSSPAVDDQLAPPEAGKGFQLSMSTTAPPGTEIWKCAGYPIPMDPLAPVNRVEYVQSPGMHHMTLSTPSLLGRTIPYGLHDCADLGGLMDGLTMFFGSQGDTHGTLQLPKGVAATLPAGIDIVQEVHVVNPTRE